MIVTVTLNPALDKTLILDIFNVSKVNRVLDIREDAGGKGINVSKLIAGLGGDTVATGVVAGPIGNFIKDQLSELKVAHDFVSTKGNTRTNTKIVDLKNKTHTDVNEPGTTFSRDVLEEVEEKLFEHLEDGGVAVFSGSVPRNVEKDIYRQWIQEAKMKGIKTILDADGELLESGIQAGPYLIKPNIHELEMLFNTKFESMEETLNYAKQLLKYDIEIIVVSMGEDGCAFI